jgi:tetratricopeptide (TPR) repeat protein
MQKLLEKSARSELGRRRISEQQIKSSLFDKKKEMNMKTIRYGPVIVKIMLLIFWTVLTPGEADSRSCEPWIAKVVSAQGIVQVRKVGEDHWMPVNLNDTYCSGDIIRVSENSRAALVLGNETFLRLDQNSTVTITGHKKEESYLVNIINGVIHFFSHFPKRVTVITHLVNASVEGTEFYVKAEPKQTLISIFEGKVAAKSQTGAFVLAGGQTAVFRAEKATELITVIRPRDAVHWALYYPPVINWKESDFKESTETDWETMVRKSIGHYWKGEIAAAFSAISGVPENIQDPRFYIYRAALLLTAGQVDAAQADINTVFSFEPSNSYALSLQSIMYTVQNQEDRAFVLAKKALDAKPSSPAAWVALSYVQQARFDLQGALNSLEQGVKSDPGNALIWANIAEILLSLGEFDKSSEASLKAVQMNPYLSKTQTIFGFSHLVHIRIDEARAVFEKAIRLDSAAPLPRLGLGLAKIRGGDLKTGRAEIEIAAGIDPNNSLVRSYLAKAYHDEKQNKSARKQFEVAKKLDPLDPTPWFYDAIHKQSVNRPVEALHDLEKSIELNDNRAVYRSRLLLDQDLAVRNAGLGRIYDDLGFQMQGLAQGWKSVNIDPTNYSAHRLLADLYPAVPRHNIARVSELLQAQLLQPLNTAPLQPLLAESDTFILENAGPTDLSTNEFSSLFLRNRLTLQSSGIVGSENTWGEEIIHSGLWNQFSYSVGQIHFESDGFRSNNDQKQDIVTGFLQAAFSPKTSVQAEVRHKDRDFGDLELLFDPERFSPNLRQNIQNNTYRLGLRHGISPESDVIVSVIGQNIDEDIDDRDDLFMTNLRENTTGYLAEALNFYRGENMSLISGIGYYGADLKTSLDLISEMPEIFSDYLDKKDRDIHHINGYFYSYLHSLNKLTLTLGFSFDRFDDERINENQLNPKLGMSWSPLSSTTVRLALFRAMRRTLISEQTIEPTQVAGFNQLFDDVPGTDIWTYGGAIDHKFNSNMFGGIQFFRRDLDVPYEEISLIVGGSRFLEANWNESVGNIYFYWAPHPWLTFKTEYRYEKFDRGNDFPGIEEIIDLKTNQMTVGCNFFHPGGLFAGLKTSYVYQKGEFGHPQFFPVIHDDDKFWVVDAGIGYRMPDRRGSVSVELKNLFDEKFKYQDIDPTNPRIVPERQIYARITLAF